MDILALSNRCRASRSRGRLSGRALALFGALSMAATLALMTACGVENAGGVAQPGGDYLPTPDQSQIQIIDQELPDGITDAPASAAYEQGYLHMREAAWCSEIAAYDEAIRIQPDVAGLYEARGTAYMYAGRHDDALADYSLAIEPGPYDAGLWRQRAHAYTIAPTPEPERGIEGATRAIELDPDHPMGYGHRAIAYTQLPTPEWGKALADMNRHIQLFAGHDPEAYPLRAWIHDNLGNHEAAEQGRRLAR